MSIIRHIAFGLAAAGLAVCGTASAQSSRPTYDEAFNAVTAGVLAGACERTETERYIRFHCEEGQALWYFTIEGRPEHEAYFVAPARPVMQDSFSVPPSEKWNGQRVLGNFGYGTLSPRAASADERDERAKAQQAWMKEVLEISKQDAEKMNPPPKRERGRLYPLDAL